MVCCWLLLDALTVQLAVEWGPSKVRVVGVAPGPIGDTEGMRRLGKTVILLFVVKY